MDNLEKVREIIADQLDIAPEDITPESTLLEDLGADSLDAVEIAMAIETEFDISVPDEALEQIATVQDLLDAIDQYA